MIIQHKYLLKILVFIFFRPLNAEYSLVNKKLFYVFINTAILFCSHISILKAYKISE